MSTNQAPLTRQRAVERNPDAYHILDPSSGEDCSFRLILRLVWVSVLYKISPYKSVDTENGHFTPLFWKRMIASHVK